ncbi:hypothetical protein LF41_976 [Lysobacter dokdonensis DS-58]|uniref:Uncharacterized protein n=1 Tax=Lysobacter dokdonensis DS-58 TaxID=1300345 RepID=A0A0A2X591_9GAMM|nr:hypothetical protein LF41_976 [Lysobacter dokdonensis DS-58]
MEFAPRFVRNVHLARSRHVATRRNAAGTRRSRVAPHSLVLDRNRSPMR